MAKKSNQPELVPVTKTQVFQTPFNRDLFPREHEKNTKPSMTIPDQTLSIREIVKRFANGLPVNGERVPMYEEHESENTGYMPDPTTMDLAEREEYVNAIDEQIREINKANRQKQKEAYDFAQKQNEERIRKAAEAAVKRSWGRKAGPDEQDSTNFS